MAQISDDEKLATLQKRKDAIHAAQLKLNRAMRAVRSRQSKQDRANDARRKIIAGALALEHMAKNPNSELARVLFNLLHEYVRPEDRRLFPFLPQLPPAPPAANVDLSDAAAE